MTGDGRCSYCGRFCLQCISDSKCTICEYGYLSEGQCKGCGTFNCRLCMDEETCFQCLSGYYLEHGKCYECYHKSSSGTCKSCNDQGEYHCLTCYRDRYLSINQETYIPELPMGKCVRQCDSYKSNLLEDKIRRNIVCVEGGEDGTWCPPGYTHNQHNACLKDPPHQVMEDINTQ